jgi:hypothetical protein
VIRPLTPQTAVAVGLVRAADRGRRLPRVPDIDTGEPGVIGVEGFEVAERRVTRIAS